MKTQSIRIARRPLASAAERAADQVLIAIRSCAQRPLHRRVVLRLAGPDDHGLRR